MEYYCQVCLNNIKAKNKYKHFKSKPHQEFDKCKHIILSHKNIDINDVGEAFYLYLIEHNKKCDCYFLRCEFKLVFNDYQYCAYLMSKLSDNKTMTPWKNFLEKVIDDFEDKRYTFNYMAEMHFTTKTHKMDMSYFFYIKHNICASEWLLNKKINRDKCLINKIPQIWRHPIIRKRQSYRTF